ncbi:hypothetical protein DIPPA_07806 [Diplonema papillatum]|nr:hypothetical protein DIPPA_07806 [Diplonema papillatum]
MKMSDAPDAGDEPPTKKKKGGKEKGAKSTPSDPLKQRLLAAQRGTRTGCWPRSGSGPPPAASTGRRPSRRRCSPRKTLK